MKKLKKSIGGVTLLFLTINAIIGTGIYFLPAFAAGIAGPASMITWLIVYAISILVAMYFAELVSMFPKSGGVYEYAKKAHGEMFGFLVGWISWIVANITIAMLIIGSLIYIFPDANIIIKIVLSISAILFFNYINYKGINISSQMLLFFGIATVVALLFLIFPGIFRFDISNFSPFFVFPASSIILAMYYLIETFYGWETSCYLAEEVKNARKVLPRMLVYSTIIIGILGISVSFVSLGIVRWDIFSVQAAPLSYVASKIFSPAFARVFSIFVFIPLIGTAASWIISSPRLIFAMSRDRVLPSQFKKIHPTNRTPYKAIKSQTLVSIIVVLFALGSFKLTLSLLIPLAIIMYSSVMISFMTLRKKKAHLKRYYKAPLPHLGPISIILANIFILLVWLFKTPGSIYLFVADISLIGLGIPLYILIKLQTDKNFIEKFYNAVSFTWDYLFPLWYGKTEMNRVLRNAKIKAGMRVLDFGCGTGITTSALAKKINKGLVVAVDISEKQISKAFKRIKKIMDMPNVVFMKEGELKFEKSSFDSIVAVGSLEHVGNPRETIEKMLRVLKKGGTFSFLCFGKSLFIPPQDFLENKYSIKGLFSGLNVELKIKKEHKKLTDYWYIYGKKK